MRDFITYYYDIEVSQGKVARKILLLSYEDIAFPVF